MVKYKSGSEHTYQVVIHILVGLIALTCVFPLIYVVGMSLTSQPELMAKNYFVVIPENPTLIAYTRILSTPVVWRSLIISAIRSSAGPAMTLSLTLLGAYVLSIKTLPGRKFLLIMVVATIIFHAGLIPTYLVLRNLGMLNTLWAMIIPLAVDSFGLLIIKVFIENLPYGLVESAQMDGAGHVQLLVWIVAPLTAPALAAIGMFNIVTHWNSWFDALVFISTKEKWPMQLILRNMLEGSAFWNDQMNVGIMASQRVGQESLKMAAVVIGTIPMLMLYPFLQKYFIHGVYLGAVKG